MAVLHKMRMSSKLENMIIDYILGINKIEPSEDIKQMADTFYFATCLLLPKESFVRIVKQFGGFDNVLDNLRVQEFIANIFRVKRNLVNMRACELYLEEKKENNVESSYNKLSHVLNELYKSDISTDEIIEFIT